ncbi:hypothetical protein EYF80_058384 [Liparis tanakae]|uniref:Uncharacterized protein n=1 Tax=Liparis tanakae TaxID=230148 RepID=A0A4Z2ERQ8_9TELE|nr:hypothetical protein EYF80_058384 [Liparis tanakae]
MEVVFETCFSLSLNKQLSNCLTVSTEFAYRKWLTGSLPLSAPLPPLCHVTRRVYLWCVAVTTEQLSLQHAGGCSEDEAVRLPLPMMHWGSLHHTINTHTEMIQDGRRAGTLVPVFVSFNL